MARKIVKVIVLGTGEVLTPDMYLSFENVRGNRMESQWDFVVKEARRAQELFELVFEGEETQDEAGEKTYTADELNDKGMRELIAIAKDKKIKYVGLSKTALVTAIAEAKV